MQAHNDVDFDSVTLSQGALCYDCEENYFQSADGSCVGEFQREMGDGRQLLTLHRVSTGGAFGPVNPMENVRSCGGGGCTAIVVQFSSIHDTNRIRFFSG